MGGKVNFKVGVRGVGGSNQLVVFPSAGGSGIRVIFEILVGALRVWVDDLCSGLDDFLIGVGLERGGIATTAGKKETHSCGDQEGENVCYFHLPHLVC